MRWLIVFAVAFTGCVMTVPPDDGIAADLACETAREIVRMRQSIKPTPTPSADACENCGGAGTLGDGKITVKCPACGGTGKKPKSVLVKPAPACANGSCYR